MEKTSFHHGDLRNALVLTAERIVDRKGVAGLALREAAREARVSANATYRHFEDKSALLAAVAAKGFAALATAMEGKMAEEAGPWDRFLATGAAYLDFAKHRPQIFDLMFGAFGAGSRHDVDGRGPGGRTPFELLADALDELVDAGVIRRRRRRGAELFVWPLVHGLAALQQSGALRRETAADPWPDTVAFIARGLGVSPALSGGLPPVP